MFDLSRQSWRYRLVAGMKWKPSASLCVFFWQLVFSILFRIIQVCVVTVFGCVVVAAFGVAAYFVITSPFMLLSDLFSREIITLESILANALGTVVAVIMISGFAWESYFKDKWRYRNQYKEKKQPSMLGAYIRAKKEKVCPRINFKD